MMLRQWFAPPQQNDEYESFAAQVLHYSILFLTGVGILSVFFVSSTWQLINIPVFLVLMGICYSLLHKGRLYQASLLFVGGLWVILTINAFETTGIGTTLISGYITIIVFSAILFPEREKLLFMGMSIISVIVLNVADAQGIFSFPTKPLSLSDRFFQQLSLLLTTGILLLASARMIHRSLERIRNHEKILMQRNQALEQEIAERQRTEANLRISEERYRLMFENIPAIAAVYAQDGEVLLINKVGAQVFGGTKETIEGRNLREFFLPDVAKCALENHELAMKEGKDILREGKIPLPNGKEGVLLRHIIPLPNRDQSPATQVLVLTADLTAKYLAEERGRELALAQERNTFLSEFFSTLSHDIKTPLTVINTSLYLLKKAVTAEQREERITRIGEQVSLMDKYIQDMLTISKLEHIPTLNFENVDLNPLIEEVVTTLRPHIEGKRIRFQFNQQPNLPPIQGDQDQLRRMLTNLIENAVNYTPTDGQVTVKTNSRNRQIILKVSDSGIGIASDALPHIFERFFRAENATAFERRGTGLGLAIVKKIVDTHAATVEVDSRIGEGTTFWVQFEAQALAEMK